MSALWQRHRLERKRFREWGAHHRTLCKAIRFLIGAKNAANGAAHHHAFRDVLQNGSCKSLIRHQRFLTPLLAQVSRDNAQSAGPR